MSKENTTWPLNVEGNENFLLSFSRRPPRSAATSRFWLASVQFKSVDWHAHLFDIAWYSRIRYHFTLQVTGTGGNK